MSISGAGFSEGADARTTTVQVAPRPVFTLTVVVNKDARLCPVRYCRNRRGAKGRICSRCLMRRWRANNPLRAAFSHLRGSARQRRIGFELTLEEFEKFCRESGYLDRKGVLPGCLHVDRKNCLLPYRADNIRPLEMLANSIKGAVERREHAAASTPHFFTEEAFSR